MSTRCAALTIGDEILCGKVCDSNSEFIASRIDGLKITVSVSDDVNAIVDALQFLRDKFMANLVIVTGGLGPTQDDVTKSAIARFFGDSSPVVEHPGFVPLPHSNHRSRSMFLLPSSAVPLANPVGTALGLVMLQQQAPQFCVAALPGVPSEMRAMFDQSLLPWVQKNWFPADATRGMQPEVVGELRWIPSEPSGAVICVGSPGGSFASARAGVAQFLLDAVGVRVSRIVTVSSEDTLESPVVHWATCGAAVSVGLVSGQAMRGQPKAEYLRNRVSVLTTVDQWKTDLATADLRVSSSAMHIGEFQCNLRESLCAELLEGLELPRGAKLGIYLGRHATTIRVMQWAEEKEEAQRKCEEFLIEAEKIIKRRETK